jgi:hypothetical protein
MLLVMPFFYSFNKDGKLEKNKKINISLQLLLRYVKDSSCSELDDTGSLTDDCEGGNEEGAGGGDGRRQRRRTDFPSEDEEGDEDEEEVYC